MVDDAKMVLQHGPVLPSSSKYMERRHAQVCGWSPSESLGIRVPYSDAHHLQREYRWQDLVYDLQHGYLVVSALELGRAAIEAARVFTG